MNGQSCCLLKVCCPVPRKQKDALAKDLGKALGWESGGDPDARAIAVADLILDNYDLVPKGVADAIVEAYRPFFEEAARGNKGDGA